MKKIGIIGAGGVGGYFGAMLVNNLSDAEVQVSFVARGEHLQEIRKEGLIVKTSDHGVMQVQPSLATDKPEELKDLDLVLLCVKSFDLDGMLQKLLPVLEEKTWIMPLLNGVDIPDRIKKVIPEAKVLPACVYIGTHIESPGVIAQSGGACRILWGADSGEFPEWLSDLFDQAGINHSFLKDPSTEIWSKYIFITSYGLVTAVYGKTLGEILSDKSLSEELMGVINEVTAVGRNAGIALGEGLEKELINKGYNFPPETKTSFQRDYENPAKKDEREIFAGTVLRLAEEYCVDVPLTIRLSGMLK